jgi:hypothetical protein
MAIPNRPTPLLDKRIKTIKALLKSGPMTTSEILERDGGVFDDNPNKVFNTITAMINLDQVTKDSYPGRQSVYSLIIKHDYWIPSPRDNPPQFIGFIEHRMQAREI